MTRATSSNGRSSGPRKKSLWSSKKKTASRNASPTIFLEKDTLLKIEEIENVTEEKILSELNNTALRVKKRRDEVIEKGKASLKQLKIAIKRVDDLMTELNEKANSKFAVKDEIEKLKLAVKKIDQEEDSNQLNKILSNFQDEMTKKVIICDENIKTFNYVRIQTMHLNPIYRVYLFLTSTFIFTTLSSSNYQQNDMQIHHIVAHHMNLTSNVQHLKDPPM